MKKWDTKYGRDEFVPPLGLDHVAKTAEELQKLSAAMQGAAADSYLRDGGLRAAGGEAGSAAAPGEHAAAALATAPPRWSPGQERQLRQLCEHVQRFLPVFFGRLQEGGEGMAALMDDTAIRQLGGLSTATGAKQP